jgi:hypothetical protein
MGRPRRIGALATLDLDQGFRQLDDVINDVGMMWAGQRAPTQDGYLAILTRRAEAAVDCEHLVRGLS